MVFSVSATPSGCASNVPSRVLLEAGLPAEFPSPCRCRQDHAGNQQVAVEHRVMRGRRGSARVSRADHVHQETPEPGVMQCWRGSFAVGLCDAGSASIVDKSSFRRDW